MPNDPYRGRTAPLTSKRCILYIYSTNTGTEYFKRGIYSPFFPLQNAVCFMILTYLVPVLFKFYIRYVLKLKKNNSVAKRLIWKFPYARMWRRVVCYKVPPYSGLNSEFSTAKKEPEGYTASSVNIPESTVLCFIILISYVRVSLQTWILKRDVFFFLQDEGIRGGKWEKRPSDTRTR